MKKIIFALLTVAIIITATGCSNSPASETATKFMQYFREENFFEMGNMSSYSSTDFILDYVGINIISYEIKSESEGKVKHKVSIEKYGGDDEEFEFRKKINKSLYPDYDIVTDTDDLFVLQSKTENITQSIIIMDVEYSDISGETKRNSVYIVIEPKKPDSEELIVTEIVGLYWKYYNYTYNLPHQIWRFDPKT